MAWPHFVVRISASLLLAGVAHASVNDSEQLAQAIDFLKRNSGSSGVQSLIILRHGETLVAGPKADEVQGIWSCTKSITSTMAGLLVADGVIELDQPVVRWVPEIGPAYSAVTFRHLLTMSSGYSAQGDVARPGGYAHGTSETPFIPGPPRFPAGAKFEYWDSAMNLLGLALTRAAKEPLSELFRRRIAEPTGMDNRRWRWGTFPGNESVPVNGGAGNYHMFQISARELSKLGQLLLQRGKWKDAQLISSAWIAEATRPQIAVDDGSERSPYGFAWWCFGARSPDEALVIPVPPRTFCASGYNNNRLFVIPEWDVVVVRLGLDGREGRIADKVWAEFLARLGRAIAAKS